MSSEADTTPLACAQHTELIIGLRHDLLRATDRAVGAEVQLEHLQREARQLAKDVERSNARVRTLATERDKLRAKIAAMHASTTWRVGRLVVHPAARLTRRRARR